MNDLATTITALREDEPGATEKLLPLLYDELRALAARKLAMERPGQTLDPTALVNEVYLRLVGPEEAPSWHGRGHFFAAAAQAMRRILVENARRKDRLRHGGGRRREVAELDQMSAQASPREVIALHEALEAFAELDPNKAKLVELRYYGGMTLAEAAEHLGMSLSTADRAWRYARAWLYEAISDGQTEKNTDPS
jgi:RNA polymerase sigma factor (TIGR02999 family)